MKLVMLRPSYSPENSAGNHLAIDLVEDFQKNGIEVEMIVSVSAKFKGLPEGYKDNCKVHRIQSKFAGQGLLTRMLRYIDESYRMYRKLVSLKDCDVIMTHSTPPTLPPLCILAAKLMKKPLLYWEQDVVSESILTTGIAKAKLQKKILYHIARIIEYISRKGSTHTITISEKFKQYHIDSGFNDSKVSVIYNWIDTDRIYPISREENKLFDELGLDRNKFYVTYCGNLGVPQNVEIMIDAAKALSDYPNIQFIIIGGGSREKIIHDYIKRKKLKNLVIFPLFPLTRACEVYNLGNIGLVIGKKGTSNNGFPSKTWTIMSAGQTMISCFDIDSELSEFVRRGNCGIAIEPDSPEKLKEAILQIYNSADKGAKYGENAHKFVLEGFSRKQSTMKFIDILNIMYKEIN
ncbi:MAG: glycosyltransferase family 4 protein [Clostridiaceae bacterium]|nr:glycosyltransferase family 4 protein [Clostridiaceae bacterium]